MAITEAKFDEKSSKSLVFADKLALMGKSPEGRGRTREVVAGGAQRRSATGGQTAKMASIGDQPLK